MKNLTKKNSSVTSSIRIKFIFILILSNASMYLLLNSPSEHYSTQNINTQKEYQRDNYLKLKLKVNLKTPLTNLPLILTNKNQSFIIKNVFIHSLVENQNLQLTEEASTLQEVILDIPMNESSKILNQKQLVLYPSGIQLNQYKRKKTYEINF